MNSQWVILLAAILLLFQGCSGKREEKHVSRTETGLPLVIASNYPLYYFAERMAGKYVTLDFPAAGIKDPALWTPGEDDMQRMGDAGLILMNGAGYEKWLDGINLPSDVVVNTCRGLERKLIPVSQPGREAGKTESQSASHTWLDLSFAHWQAENIKEALVTLLPEHQRSIDSAFRSLGKDLSALDYGMSSTGFAIMGRQLYFSKPVYQYMERRYQLHGTSFDWDPGTMPARKMWKDFLRKQGDRQAGIMIWHQEPGTGIKRRLESAGIKCIVFHTCETLPDRGDFVSEMESNINRLQTVPLQDRMLGNRVPKQK